MNILRGLLRPPFFDDEDESRAAAPLHFILISSIAIDLISILASVLSRTFDVQDLQLDFFLFLVEIGLLVLLYRRKLRLSSLIFCIASWLMIASTAYQELGILNPIFSTEALIVIAAGLLISSRAALVVAIVSSLYGAWLVYAAESGQFIAELGSLQAREVWITEAGFFILTALFLTVSLRAIRESRERAVRDERALRASEEQYRQLFEANPHPMVVANLETQRFLAVNDAAVAKYGYSREEFLRLTTRDLRLPEDLQSAAAGVERYERENLNYFPVGVVRHVKKDGSLFYVELVVNRMMYQGQRAVVAATYDLTERLRAEAALRGSEARLSGILDSAMDAIITIDEQQNVIYFNASAESMFQCPAIEAIGHPISRFIPERFREDHEEYIHMFGRKGVTNRRMGALSALSGLRANGDEFPVEASISQIEVEAQKFYTVILRDITERKQAEEALRRSEELFSTIFQTVPVAISITAARDARILNINRYSLEMMGFEAEEVIGHSTADLDFWSQPGQRTDFLEELQQKGLVRNQEGRWKTKSGGILDVLVSMQPMEIGGEPCVLVIALDITERKQTERERLEVYKEREILELKERFISTMSHEFRTPLAVILAANDTLRHYYERMKAERREEHFDNIHNQVRYVTDMLDEVLTLSKARAGKMPFNPAPMSLVVFCEKLFEQMQTTDSAHHEFTFVTDGEIGEIMGDTNLLQHVLVNLLSNAIKYSAEGGEVRFALSRDDDYAVIRISDQGIGIPEDDQKHLFEAFYRASNTKSIKGTGLGLAIVKESVETHGGTIACESAAGKGTTFIVRLPIDSKITTREIET